MNINNKSLLLALLAMSCSPAFSRQLPLEGDSTVTAPQDTAFVKNGGQLSTLEVKASRIIKKLDYQILLPSNMQVKASTNGLSLLRNMQLSRIVVNTVNNTVTTTSGDDVELRINGVKATLAEVKALRPADVKKIEYHDTPTLRYNNAIVIDVLLKNREQGGDFSTDLTNSIFNWGLGDYMMSGSYHKGKSSLKAVANCERRDLKWTRENYEYYNGDTPHQNIEEGLPTKVKYSNMDFTLGYNYQAKKDNLSLTLRDSWSVMPNDVSDRKSILKRDDMQYNIWDHTKSWNNSPSLDVYYQHDFNSDSHLYVDLLGTYIRSSYDRLFTQTGQNSKEQFASGIDGKKYSLIGEVIYEQDIKKDSKLSLGMKQTQAYTKNQYDGTVNDLVKMNSSETYAYSEFSSRVSNFNYAIGVGVMRTYNNQEGNKLDHTFFRPSLKLSYRAGDHLSFRYNGYLSGYAPSLSNLSDVTQDIDIYESKRGNPNLKSVKFVSNDFSVNLNFPFMDIEWFTRYSYDDKPFMEETLYENGRYIRYIDNQKGFHRVHSQLDIQFRPYKDYFTIRLTPFVNRYISYGNSYTHTHTNWGFNGSLLAVWKNWNLSAEVNTSYHHLWGETLSKEESEHTIALGYNFAKWYWAVEMVNPFTKTYKQSDSNLSALAPYENKAYSKDLRRILMLNVGINLAFGKQKKAADHRINNSDTDAGILTGSK